MWFKSPMNLNNRINETNRYNLYIKQPRNVISRITEEKNSSKFISTAIHKNVKRRKKFLV